MSKIKDNTLLFVYNADSTLFAQVSDSARRVFAPQTYSCNLCMITYGWLGMKEEWKDFLETLPANKIFLHRDEFVEKFPGCATIPLPAIFVISSGVVNELISALEINHVKSVGKLKELLLLKLNENLNL